VRGFLERADYRKCHSGFPFQQQLIGHEVFQMSLEVHEKSSDDEQETREKKEKKMMRARWRAQLFYSYFIEALNRSF